MLDRVSFVNCIFSARLQLIYSREASGANNCQPSSRSVYCQPTTNDQSPTTNDNQKRDRNFNDS